MAGNATVGLWHVPEPDEFGNYIGDQGVVEAIENPTEEGVHFEEDAFLAQLVKLGITIEKAGGDELVENSHRHGWCDSEQHIVKGQSPGFEDDLSGEGILERILEMISMENHGSELCNSPKIASCRA
jgi:hypothetical protein